MTRAIIHFLGITFFTMIIIGCDPLTKSEIINNCDSDILVQLQFDKDLLDSTWHGANSYIAYLNDFGGMKDNRILFDSINLIATYRLTKNDTFLVHGAVGTHPRFIFNRLVLIKNSDTVNFDGYDKIYSKFESIGPRFFEFNISDKDFLYR